MRKDLSQDILIIAVLALTSAILWIYIGVRQTIKKSDQVTPSAVETEILVPKLDTSVIEELKKKTP